ncbi:MAG: ParB/RepB/Spo0J family partition protein [Phycisphaerales bacterium]
MFDTWAEGEVRALSLDQLGERYHRYRLSPPELEQQMVRSLRRHGQLAPLVVVLQEGAPQVLDGFKRLAAARQVEGLTTLTARRLAVDERGAKAAIYTLNQVGRQLQELEEAWIVHALVREDGLSQVEVASLLGRHKSWVHRRLALLERLCVECQDDLRLGLLSVTMARQLVRLPTGNQLELLEVQRRTPLSTREFAGLVDLWLAARNREQQEYLLREPREALRAARGFSLPSWDPRLSRSGNRLSKQLGNLLDGLSRLENWLQHRGFPELCRSDRQVLWPAFEKLVGQCQRVAESGEGLRSGLV